jgi:YVTN family beta-propeller protein
LGYNGQVYVENFDDGTISVIDANTGDVVNTIVAGSSPSGISLVGTNIYYSSFQDGLVRIIDTTTGELTQNISDSGSNLYGNSAGGGGGSAKKNPPQNAPTITVSTQDETPLNQPVPVKFEFKNNLKVGVVMNDVLELQKYLNANGFTLVSFGPGAKGNETTKFGKLTKLAVMKFQKANGLVADGLVGPKTRAVLNK